MIGLYLTDSESGREHDAGVALARYAVRRAFGIDVQLCYTSRGKPYAEEKGIFLSISHSHGLCAAAVSDSEIGVDIEYIDPERPNERLMRLASRFFSPDECEYVAVSPERRFWEVWTAKESLIKYTGEGLAAMNRSVSSLGSTLAFSRFEYSGCAGCICSRESVKAAPIFVDNAEIAPIL